jgi:hypothetical protein
MQSDILIGQAKFVIHSVLIYRPHANPPAATDLAGLTASRYKGVHWSIGIMDIYSTFKTGFAFKMFDDCCFGQSSQGTEKAENDKLHGETGGW